MNIKREKKHKKTSYTEQIHLSHFTISFHLHSIPYLILSYPAMCCAVLYLLCFHLNSLTETPPYGTNNPSHLILSYHRFISTHSAPPTDHYFLAVRPGSSAAAAHIPPAHLDSRLGNGRNPGVGLVAVLAAGAAERIPAADSAVETIAVAGGVGPRVGAVVAGQEGG
jgi:hypothetical protein